MHFLDYEFIILRRRSGARFTRSWAELRWTMSWSINISHNAIAFKQKLHLKVPIKIIGIIQLDINWCRNKRNESCDWRLQKLKLWGNHHWKVIRLSTKKQNAKKKKQRLCGSNKKWMIKRELKALIPCKHVSIVVCAERLSERQEREKMKESLLSIISYVLICFS